MPLPIPRSRDLSIQHQKDDPSQILWDSVAAVVVAGKGDVWGHYKWPDGTASTLLERAWSEPAERASWDDVRPVVEACLGRGHPAALVSPVRSVPMVVTDPVKLQGWLDLGVDPFALYEGRPLWWALIPRGRTDLLDVVAAHPAWARHTPLRSATGVSTLMHWAQGEPSGTPSLPTPIGLAMLDRLHQHLGAAAVRDEAFWHALLDRVRNLYERKTPSMERESPALPLWDHLVRHEVPATEVDAVTRSWKRWNNAHRSFRQHHPMVHHRLFQALEARQLANVETGPDVSASTDVPSAPVGETSPSPSRTGRRRL